jgi:molybdate transport system substrate-binding protein
VFAASSLTDAFGELERTFEAANPSVDVSLVFAGSQILRLQIEQGAPADVFASADAEHVQALVNAGLARDARVFGHNELVVIVPAEGPTSITSFADLPTAERLVLGAPQVPVGRYAREALRRANTTLGADFEAQVLARVVSEEANVRLARAKVELGEADAAIVYVTDAVGSQRVRQVAVPPEANVQADLVIGTVTASAEGDLARAWTEWVLGSEGRQILRLRGFALP